MREGSGRGEWQNNGSMPSLNGGRKVLASISAASILFAPQLGGCVPTNAGTAPRSWPPISSPGAVPGRSPLLAHGHPVLAFSELGVDREVPERSRFVSSGLLAKVGPRQTAHP